MRTYKVREIGVAIFLAIILPIILPGINGGRILVLFPISSKSMINLFQPLVRGLVNNGHQVTAVTPVKLKIESTNLTEFMPYTLDELFGTYPDPFEIRKQAGLFKLPVDFQVNHCHKFYQNKEFRKLMREKYDVIIVNINYHDCFAGLLHEIGSPIIIFATMPMPSVYTEVIGSTLPSSFSPIVILDDISAQLSFVQRTKNFMYNVYFDILLNVWARPSLEKVYREYLGNDVPSIVQIYKKQVSLFLINAHFSITNPKQLLPSIVEIGGMHCGDRESPLPKDLEEFVSGAKDGFIVFSLGSIVKATAMPEPVRRAFLKSFGKLKQRVVWKWEKDGGMEDLPDNVKLVKWLPQRDLLRHPNVTLFITHGGLLSTEEAVYHGVPVLGMPVFLDQDTNMRQAEILGFGVKGEILGLTESKLTPLIRKILDNPSYTHKAKELSAIFRDQPQSPLERAIYWTEYVIKHHGAYHLRSSGMYLNIIQYYSVDVMAFLTVLAAAAAFTAFYLVKLLAKIVISLLPPKRLGIGGNKDKQKTN